MKENEISKIVVDLAYHIHKDIGTGLLESAYEKILINELRKKNLQVENQVPIPISYNGFKLEEGFRADIIIEKKVIIELKSAEEIHPAHKKQLTTYLKLSGYHLGLLINFGSPYFKKGIVRIVNNLPEP